MYWFPAILFFFEIFYLMNIPSLLKTLAFNALLSQLTKDRNKETQQEYLKNWGGITHATTQVELPKEKATVLSGLYHLIILIYFLIGMFYPLWWISLIIFSLIILNVILSKNIIKAKNLEYFLDLSEFDDGVIPQKLERKMKLSSIDNNYNTKSKIILTKEYLFSIIRMSTYASIIILHQYAII